MTATIEATRPGPAAGGGLSGRRRDDSGKKEGTEALIRGLGWFSIALGAAEIIAPEAVGKLVGLRTVKDPAVIRMFGFREMAAGLGILASSSPTPWVWARVGGDVLDLATLGAAGRGDVDRDRVLASVLAVAGVTALDVYAARQSQPALRTNGARPPGQIEVRKTVTIARPPSEVYAFWRDLENLPRFMAYLDSVRVLDDRRSAWKAKGPIGSQYEWQAEITDDRPGERIAWRSLPPSDAFNTGVVLFKPAPRDQGTEVHVELRYEPPAGPLGAAVARLFGKEPGQEVMSDLRRLKQVLEMGEVMHSDASVATGPHPARPGALKGARR
jgi:uncharacterized membrane protein